MPDEPDESEKTEDPSEKKLKDAFEKGNVVKSQEVNSWFMLTAATLVILIFSNGMSSDLALTLKSYLANAHTFSMEGKGGGLFLQSVMWAVFAAIALPFLVFIIAALAGNMVQHGLLFQTETMTPKLSKISPLAGFKRLFSMTSLVNFLKSLVKLTIVTLLIVLVMWPSQDSLEVMVSMDLAALLPHVKVLSLKILGAVVALY